MKRLSEKCKNITNNQFSLISFSVVDFDEELVVVINGRYTASKKVNHRNC